MERHNQFGHESWCIKEIVDTVSHNMHLMRSSSSGDFIGIETLIQDLNSNLAGSHDWFGEESQIITTTSDVHLFSAYRVDMVHDLSVLDTNEAVELFQKNTFHEYNIPIKDYKLLWKGYKYLQHLRDLNLRDVHNMVNTLDFGGLPCLQVLKLHYCSSLEEIHSSIGHHSSLVHLSITWCHKLKMLPTIKGMKKLKKLEIMDCDALHEFCWIGLGFSHNSHKVFLSNLS